MKDFQLAFFKSGLRHIDIPQDHAFVEFYFDPLNVHSIFEAIQRAFSDENIRQQKIIAGKQKLNSMLFWEQVFKKIQDIVSDVLKYN